MIIRLIHGIMGSVIGLIAAWVVQECRGYESMDYTYLAIAAGLVGFIGFVFGNTLGDIIRSFARIRS